MAIVLIKEAKMLTIELINKLCGTVALLGGIYGLLVAYRILPINSGDPERMELWHCKFGKIMKIISPIIIVFGILWLLGIL